MTGLKSPSWFDVKGTTFQHLMHSKTTSKVYLNFFGKVMNVSLFSLPPPPIEGK